MKELFEKFDDEFLKFERIKGAITTRPDLHAFILLDRLLPGNRDIVAAAGHEQIWLDVDLDRFAEVATEEIIRDLRRCGVFFEEDTDSLSMFR